MHHYRSDAPRNPLVPTKPAVLGRHDTLEPNWEPSHLKILKAVNKMRLSKLALFAALLSPGLVATAFAQHGGGGHGGGGHAGGSGGRSGGFSGGGGIRGGSVGGFRGGAVGGFRGGVGRGYYYGGRWYGGSGVYLGFGYPYYGYGYGYPYYYGYDPYYYGYDPYAYDGSYSSAPPPQQNYGYDQGYPQQGQGQAGPPPQQQQPQYGPPPQTQPQSANQGVAAQFYLIAFSDHTIQAATAYKVEGDQLYWQDRDNQEHHVPLSKIDVPFSQQINRDRHVDFQIP
jgi:hypothetical protein